MADHGRAAGEEGTVPRYRASTVHHKKVVVVKNSNTGTLIGILEYIKVYYDVWLSP